MSNIPNAVKALLVRQLTIELGVHIVYRKISLILDQRGYEGASLWFKKASEEEHSHWDKILTYLADRNDISEAEPIPNMQNLSAKDLPSLLSCFERALEFEKTVTQALEELAKESQTNGDFTTLQFINWFLDEQVSSEKEIDTYVRQLRDYGDTLYAVRLWDNELLEKVSE